MRRPSRSASGRSACSRWAGRAPISLSSRSARSRSGARRCAPREPRSTRIVVVKLDDEERAMLAGELGPVRKLALQHQLKVGEFFGAADFVRVTQAHIMA